MRDEIPGRIAREERLKLEISITAASAVTDWNAMG